MIGVAAPAGELEAVAEFFELFKTPWEPVAPGRQYDVVVSSSVELQDVKSPVLLAYGAAPLQSDTAHREVSRAESAQELRWDDHRFPLFGQAGLFESDSGHSLLSLNGRPADHKICASGLIVWRVGYDLFAEIKHLLTVGQPAEHASTPTVEWHIELLRQLLLQSGVSFVEIPPRPAGFDFACCLTHDLDFYGIRRHGLDRTMAGFVSRASVGTLLDWVSGRRSTAEAFRNWKALLSLPLVMLRLAPDFWKPFRDYEQVESGLPATYFVIPFKNTPGVAPDGSVARSRSVAYQASEVRTDIRQAVERGREVALHGIDSWRDDVAGRVEMAQIAQVTGNSRIGIRMHWLYFDAQSPARLEDAGFDYDSTWGFNDAVGFRPGTSQVFRLTGSRSLMELPLTIMDSALFYAGRLNLTFEEARRRWAAIVVAARRFGGNVVINWHDRSLAPERQWERAYRALLKDVMDGNRPWFATAQQAVDWFRWRRSIAFRRDRDGCVLVTGRDCPTGLPPASVTVQRPTGHRSEPPVIFEGGRDLAVRV